LTGVPLLKVEDLHTSFRTARGTLRAVGGLSFQVEAGETVAIVGESGSGKSVSAMSILRLLPESQTSISGRIDFDGQNLLALSEPEMRKIRGNRIGMIFQEPMSSLNPVMTVGDQIDEAVRLHRRITRRDAHARVMELLMLVGIPAPAQRIREYPHQLSGGMRQRVMIAMALACDPALLIADEPTTALDVTVQAQILDLMQELKQRLGSAVILITHDLGVVSEVAQRVVIMYAGRKVEEATTRDIFSKARHPYTVGLLAAIPRPGSSLHEDSPQRLAEIAGIVPDLNEIIPGCPFAPRCAHATATCFNIPPRLVQVSPTQMVACHYAEAGTSP
jgi:peptide/nickel transport system ATP-binding protein